MAKLKFWKNKNKRRKVKVDTTFLTSDIGKEKEYFLENLSLMLAAGIDILEILDALGEEVGSKLVKKIIHQVKIDIENGNSISESLAKVKVLPDHLLYLIRVGEQSARLSENMNIVIEQRKKDAEFKGKLRSASLYPGFVIVLMTIIGLGVATFILPRLSNVYKSLDIDLPATTRFLLGAGDFLEQYGIIAVPGFLIAMTALFYFVFVFRRTRFIGQAIMLNTPYFKRLIQEVEVSRFGFLMGSLLNAGLTIDESLELLVNSTPYFAYQKLYAHLEEQIQNGMSFKQSFKSYKKTNKLMPLYARELIYSSEKSGKLSESFLIIGNTYEKRNEETTKDLSVVIEPILLFVVWGAVAFLALSIIMPIYGLVGNLNSVSQGATIDELSTGPTQEELDLAAAEFDQQLANASDEVFIEISEGNTDFIPESSIQINGEEGQKQKIRDDIGGKVIAEVSSLAIFEYINYDQGWYQIVLNSGTYGWISEIYVTKLN